MDKPFFTISEETGAMIKSWCESGIEAPPPPKPNIAQAALDKAIARIIAGEDLTQKLKDTYTLTPLQLEQLEAAKPQ